jgi:hypothetical protein
MESKPPIFGVDMARPGADVTVWYCSECGITTYPCNHVKDQLARERAARSGEGK